MELLLVSENFVDLVLGVVFFANLSEDDARLRVKLCAQLDLNLTYHPFFPIVDFATDGILSVEGRDVLRSYTEVFMV